MSVASGVGRQRQCNPAPTGALRKIEIEIACQALQYRASTLSSATLSTPSTRSRRLAALAPLLKTHRTVVGLGLPELHSESRSLQESRQASDITCFSFS